VPRELAQLLVDEGAVAASDVDRAQARQREAGGTLDSALLELGLISEEQLLGLLSRASDLPAAPLSAYEAVDARARRVFPSKVAERHGLAPFALDGRELSLVATHPLDLGLLDEISFMLSLHLSPHVGPEWRVRGLIHRLYGSSLSPRLQRLAGGGPTVPAPPQTPPAPPPEPTPAQAPAPAPADRPGMPVRPPGFTGFARDAGEPLEPLAAALAQAAEAFDIPWGDEPIGPGGSAGPSADGAAQPDGAPATEPAPPRPPPRPVDRTAPPHWTMERARAVLAGAENRDEVVLATLRYARDFFQYAALFAVTRDAVAGHDALGADDGMREVCRTVALYASDPGIFRTAIDTLAPYLGPVSREAAGSVAVLDGLGRGAPRAALVYPILLRDRPVCVLYADNGAAPVSARRLGDLLLYLSTVGNAFERIIRARKDRPAHAVSRRPAVPPDGAPDGPATALAAAAPSPPEAAPAEPPPAPAPPAGVAAAPQVQPVRASEVPLPEAPLPVEPLPVEPSAEVALPEAPLAEAPPVEAVVAEVPATEPSAVAVEPVPAPEPEPVPEAPPSEPPPAAMAAGATGEADEPASLAAPAMPVEQAAPEAAVPPSTSPEVPPEIAFAFADENAPDAPVPPPVAAPADQGPLDPATLVGRYLITPRGSDERASLLAQLVDRSDEVAPILVDQLPGPLDVEREALARTAAADQGPVLAAVAALGPAGVRPLMALLGDAQPARRRAAAALLGQAGDARAFLPLADRCFDPDPDVAEAARLALAAHRRDPAMKPVPERLRRALLSGLADRATAAARAISALRDAESIPLLIQALEGSDASTAAASAAALAAITMQRHGTAARKWLMWWKENRGRGRAEWLFGALTSEDRELRLAAAEELRGVAPSPVAYSADLSPLDREAAARAWASWFARGGHRI